MEMQTGEIYIPAPADKRYQFIELVSRNPELVFVCARSYVDMRMCVDIRIDTDTYPRPFPEPLSHRVYYIYFLQ